MNVGRTPLAVPLLSAFAIANLFLGSVGRAADLAPGNPPLTQDLADLRRDAVEVVFDVQFTARQLREHQRLYAWYWKYAKPEWQKAEQAALPEFRGVIEKPKEARKALREKYRVAWTADAREKAAKGSPYHTWLLAKTAEAAEVVAAGPPALRRDVLENTLEFVQWGLRMQLTVRQQEAFRAMAPKEWSTNIDEATRKTIVGDFMTVYRKVVRFAPSDRTAVLKLVEPMLLDALKKPESAFDKWMADAYADANRVLGAGPPDTLTAGGAAQHADFYDWSLGLRLPDSAREELRRLIAEDWKTIESSRSGTISTARLMDDPPSGGAGALARARDRASTLLFISGQPTNPVNRVAMAEYRKAHPNVVLPTLPDSKKVIAAGDPPLTEGEAERSRLAFEWLFGFEFSPEQRAAFRKTQLAEWERKDREAMLGTIENAYVWTQLVQFTPEDRALVRAYALPQFLKSARETADRDPGNKWLLEQYDARHPSLVKGKPGPTLADAEALGELLRFQTLEVTGGDKATADKVASAAVAKVKTGVGTTDEVTGAALQLALVRHVWPTLGEAEKQELRDRWADALRPVGVKAKLAAWQSTPAPARELDYIAAMRQLQQQQQNAAMISNMLRMQHQTNMTIIWNMGNTPYTYRYEYRRR